MKVKIQAMTNDNPQNNKYAVLLFAFIFMLVQCSVVFIHYYKKDKKELEKNNEIHITQILIK